MERKNIPFQYGIHRTPSAGAEGELSECVNLEMHSGELTPSVMPEVAFTLAQGDKLLFVHTTGSYRNYIIQRGTSLCWFSNEDKDTVHTIGTITPTSIHAVGNTLVVLSENDMEYILFKSGDYKRIGNKPPFCSISFGLNSHEGVQYKWNSYMYVDEIIELDNSVVDILSDRIQGNNTSDVMYNLENEANDLAGNSSPMVDKMTELYHASVNKGIAAAAKQGYFVDSFFIRYAYRMYDGSHYMQSAPCFFPINTDGYLSVLGGIQTIEKDNGLWAIAFSAIFYTLFLDYQIVGLYNEGVRVANDTLDDWTDVIEGIDVFVTKGISRIDNDSRVFGFSNTDFQPSGIMWCGSEFIKGSSTYKNNPYNIYNTTLYLNVEKNSEEVFIEKIKNTSLFYKVASFNVNGLSSKMGIAGRTILPIKEDTLTNLEQQDVLDDDYDSHNKIIPSFAHVYNGRLNIAGIRTKLFSGYPMESMVPYTYDYDSSNYRWTSRIALEVEGRDVWVVAKSNIALHENPAFIFYPSAKVKSFALYRYNSLGTNDFYSASFAAEVHKLLNGSFYLSPNSFGMGDYYKMDTTAIDPSPYGDPYVSYPNKLYTSEVNNPFFFPLSGRNSIGTGEIIAISSNTKAISPGQFGQYPLIVFSTDGVWALQTGEEGLYYSVHPISKDICCNPNVLQTDGPIIFATANGLHALISEQVDNISAVMKGQPDTLALPSVDDAFDLLSGSVTDSGTFNQFISQALFAYDYINSRILIYRPDHPFAYVYSMDGAMFSKLVLVKDGKPVAIESTVRAYPEVFMQSGTDIYTFVEDKDVAGGQTVPGLAVTRPLTFDDPLAMKVMNDIRIVSRRTSALSRCRYLLYASNDGYHWARLTSLRGRSFKYFRFAVLTELTDIDALQGMSVRFDYRRTGKLR